MDTACDLTKVVAFSLEATKFQLSLEGLSIKTRPACDPDETSILTTGTSSTGGCEAHGHGGKRFHAIRPAATVKNYFAGSLLAVNMKKAAIFIARDGISNDCWCRHGLGSTAATYSEAFWFDSEAFWFDSEAFRVK